MIYAALIFTAALLFIFTPLDVLKREVPNKVLYPIFVFCLAVYLIIDFLIFGNVTLKEIGIGIILFCLTYIVFTAAVMKKTIGPADIKIVSAFVLFAPVYFVQTMIGITTLPAIDLICNYLIFALPVAVLIKKVQPTHSTPALVIISLAVLSCFCVGNVLMTVLVMIYI